MKLHELGFTAQEAGIYVYLIKKGSAPAVAISRSLKIPAQSVYRSVYRLKDQNLISAQPGWPVRFIVQPPKVALADYLQNKTLGWSNLIETMMGTTENVEKVKHVGPTKVNLIFGQPELFQSSVRAFAKAQSEILVISIGEELPVELILAQRRATERGVTSRMIAHKCDSGNRELLRNFQRNGIEVRHFPDWGFHLVIVDSYQAILAANNPKKTAERVGIEFFSVGLAKALRDYFYSVWAKAKEIV